MKYILLFCIVAFTVSCTEQYKANVHIEYCTGKMDTINIQYRHSLNIITHEQAVPVLMDYWNNIIKYNICDYRILSQTEVE